MIVFHGQNWHREVHPPSSWVCPLCAEDDSTFVQPQGLAEHMAKSHRGIFAEHQIQAIVRRSRLGIPHPQDICPLCCFSMDEQNPPERYRNETTFTENPNPKTNLEDSSKRHKTDTG
jgi:hypothetical protein